ncbi:RpoS-dependent hydroperoxidase II [Klebsiella pneumoniae subsp. rhinoscleromatis]|nr:RpoS-dependent hydroperoxidase II [Klebsiella pneumoniae subsp. rhinoscleromatis]
MEGFGIHTFRLINAEGKATFVRFHWKPVAGKASLVWDEAQKLTGRDPRFSSPRSMGGHRSRGLPGI